MLDRPFLSIRDGEHQVLPQQVALGDLPPVFLAGQFAGGAHQDGSST
jgi:hypothetical protein